MSQEQINLKRTARIAGFIYLLIAITGVFGIMYVPMQLIDSGNLPLTMRTILRHEFLFRAGIMSNLVCQTLFVFLVLQLYKLFQQVSKHLTRTMFALVIVGVPIAFVIIFNQLFALLLLKENFMKSFPPAQLQVLVMAFLKMYNYGNVVIGIFWGLWLIPFGQLVYRSGFMPKILGILLIIGGSAYVLDAFAFVLSPDYHYSVTGIIVGLTSSVAEFAMVFWLLIKGVRKVAA
ncbi:uncharacterized protein DUF4386 [Flavobacterium sp. 90]|uniref:DUF4386 domain-containing protein n=1 Tax=unclassified Flavobacterium TaxID=196869 RepID=UPI000EADD3C8|nr:MULTISPECIES: DUF4386 domain-containing protein [unclassified Flavobacterium]RKR08497.1 uncharacterized protein DUF4386 [Flavobacterium sp. 81]TCK52291.1 uncharacterized protein DUF4386 [Flavobacterium sp. 90]